MKTYIQVSRPGDNFTILENETIENSELSWRAKGVLCYLAGRPPGWRPQIKDIVNHGREGEHAVYAAMKELRLAGYAKLVTLRHDGRISAKVWKVRTSLNRKLPLDRENLNQENLEHNNKEHTSRAKRVGVGAIGLASSFHEFTMKSRRIKNKRPNIQRWTHAFQDLIDEEGEDQVRRVMKWYFENYRNQYTPTCDSGPAFCSKFINVLKSMRNETGDEDEGPTVRRVSA